MHKKVTFRATKKEGQRNVKKQKIPICCIEKPKKHEDEKSNSVNEMKKKQRKRMIVG